MLFTNPRLLSSGVSVSPEVMLSLGHVCCFLLEDHSSFFISTTNILVGKQQNIPVATSSTSVCTSEHTFSPEYVVLCYAVSILICF